VERHFAAVKITNDAAKISYVHANLADEEQDVVEDILCDPKTDYETLKKEILKRFTESENIRIQRFLGSEEMWDRTPSQFYRHLLNLATPDVSESMVLTLWKRRLPLSTQHVLAALVNVDAATIVTVADSIHEVPQPPGQVAAATPVTTTAGQRSLRLPAIRQATRSN
jgi:hypothetical protein